MKRKQFETGRLESPSSAHNSDPFVSLLKLPKARWPAQEGNVEQSEYPVSYFRVQSGRSLHIPLPVMWSQLTI